MEYLHHGDELVPRQQRFSQYTRSLMKALNIPVINQWGLRPAVVKEPGDRAAHGFRDLTSWACSTTSPPSISIRTCHTMH